MFDCEPSQKDPIMTAARSSMLGAGMSNSSFKYSRLAADEDGYIDLQVSHSDFGSFFFKTITYGRLFCTSIQKSEAFFCFLFFLIVNMVSNNTLKFKKSPPKVPYKAIALAIFLFLIGSMLIIFGSLLLSGVIQVEVSSVTVVKAICQKLLSVVINIGLHCPYFFLVTSLLSDASHFLTVWV